MKLNLETKTKEQELIKQYLEENVSEILAEKINNGVKIEKDNKTLINKKDLDGFMNYANAEARKLAEKGSNYACIEDKIVYGWAVHYFEEDEIVGNLFNEDGTEYKVEIKKITPKTQSKPEPKKPEKQQTTLFDLMTTTDKEDPTKQDLDEPPIEYDEVEETDNNIEDFSEQEIDEELDKVANEIVRDSNVQIDKQTGEVLSQIKAETTTIDKDYMKMLYVLLDGKLTLNKE